MPICYKCQSAFPNKVFIDGKERNFQNRKYCMACSPFGKHNTKKIHLSSVHLDRICPRCKSSHPVSSFYSRRGKEGSSVYCKQCTLRQTIERQQTFKKICVEYKGGACEKCGYNKCIAALDFHHKNEKQKDFSISRARHRTLNQTLKNELDKCQLLCANCHREVHYEKYPRQDLNL